MTKKEIIDFCKLHIYKINVQWFVLENKGQINAAFYSLNVYNKKFYFTAGNYLFE